MAMGGSPPLHFSRPFQRLFWAWGALLDMCQALLGTVSSLGHRGLSWPCVSSTSAWGAFLATPGGLSWPPWRGQLVPTALTLGRDGLAAPCVIQLWGRGGEEQIISKLGLPSGNSFYLTNKEVLGALQPRWSWIGSCASVKFCCYKTKLN